MESISSRGNARVWAATVIAVAFLIRLVPALRRPLHNDEQTSLWFAAMPVQTMQNILHFKDVHPPLFFLTLHVLGLASVPVWLARLLMIACGTISVGLLFATVRLWAPLSAAIIAALVAAFMPSLIFYDTWIRMYALGYMLMLLSWWLLSLILVVQLTKSQRLGLWVAWAICAAASAYTLYLAWFVIAAELLYVVFVRRDALVGAALATFGAVVLWLPQLRAFLDQTATGGVNFATIRSHELATIALLPGQATLAPELEGWAAVMGAIIAWIWIALALYQTIALRPDSLLPWFIMPCILLLGYSLAAHKLIYLDRYYLFLAYGVAAWTGCACAPLLARGWSPQRSLLAAAAGALALLGIAFAFDPRFYTADWPSVEAALEAQAQPSDLIILEQGNAEWSLFRIKQLAQHPHFMVWVPANVSEAEAFARKYKRIWLVAYEPRGADPDLLLPAYLQQHYRLQDFQQYNRAIPAEDVALGLFSK